MNPEALQMFYEQDFQPMWGESLDRLEVEFQTRKELLKQEFVKSFSKACRQMQEKQKTGYKPASLHYDLLRTRIASHRYAYPITAYGAGGYLEEGERVGELEAGFFYQYFEDAWKEMRTKFRKYVGKINETEVDRMMMGQLGDIQAYVAEWMRLGIKDAVELEEYSCIKKAAKFTVQTGELYEPGGLIYQEWPGRDAGALKEWLGHKEETSYCFSDFQGLDLAELDGSGIDLRYANFRGSRLEGARFFGSRLEGVNFRKCRLERSRMCACLLSDADLEGADLRGADLRYSVSLTGRGPGSSRKTPGFTGTSFRNSRLEGCRLQSAAGWGRVWRMPLGEEPI